MGTPLPVASQGTRPPGAGPSPEGTARKDWKIATFVGCAACRVGRRRFARREMLGSAWGLPRVGGGVGYAVQSDIGEKTVC